MTRTNPTRLDDSGGPGPDEGGAFDSVVGDWLLAGYVRARFAGEPVLITPEFAREIREAKTKAKSS